MVWWLVASAMAGEVRVCSPYAGTGPGCVSSLAEALKQHPDEIVMGPGVHLTDGVELVDRVVRIRALDPDDRPVLSVTSDAWDAVLAIRGGSVVLQNLEIDPSHFLELSPYKDVRGLHVTGGGTEVLLNRVSVYFGYHSFAGGGMRVDGGAQVFVVDSVFSRNGADSQGGHIDVDGASVALLRTYLELGYAPIGAGVNVADGSLTVQDSTFDGAWSDNSGGAIALQRVGHAVVDRSWFCGNRAIYGAAIYAFESCEDLCALSHNVFQGGKAAQVGGALFFDHSTGPAVVSHNSFLYNTATYWKAAAADFFEGRAVVFESNLVVGNDSSAAAVVLDPFARGSVSNNAWFDNAAHDLGGPEGAKASLPESDFSLSVAPRLVAAPVAATACGEPAIIDPGARVNGTLVDHGIGAFNEDADGDGVLVSEDCHDDDPTAYPGADEIPADAYDSNCDGQELCFVDGDGDGFGGSETVLTDDFTCTLGPFVPVGGDCLDSDPSVTQCHWVTGGGGCHTVPPVGGASGALLLLLGWLSVRSGTRCSSSRSARRW